MMKTVLTIFKLHPHTLRHPHILHPIHVREMERAVLAYNEGYRSGHSSTVSISKTETIEEEPTAAHSLSPYHINDCIQDEQNFISISP